MLLQFPCLLADHFNDYANGAAEADTEGIGCIGCTIGEVGFQHDTLN